MFKSQITNLNIRSKEIRDGILDNKFGGYGSSPKVSFDLEWDKVEGAKSYALLMIDYDAVHVVGFPFIHWVVGNIYENKLALDATHLNKDIIQGQNSITKIGWLNTRDIHDIKEPEILENANYTGPRPPDKTHTYTIYLMALDIKNLSLKNGFFLDEMLHEIKDHVITYDILNFDYIKN